MVDVVAFAALAVVALMYLAFRDAASLDTNLVWSETVNELCTRDIAPYCETMSPAVQFDRFVWVQFTGMPRFFMDENFDEMSEHGVAFSVTSNGVKDVIACSR